MSCPDLPLGNGTGAESSRPATITNARQRRADTVLPRTGSPSSVACSTRRRGSLYVAVLSMALLITLIGVSATLATRVELRALVDTEAAAKADFGATSITDLALFWVSANTNWRTAYANNTWTAPLVADGMTLRYKLVDELDGNLANDPTQPVRLYAKAIVGVAVRMESVLCQPTGGWNLVTNGSMESGSTGWYTRNGAFEVRTDAPHSGADYVRVKGRTLVTDGLGQRLTSGIKSGTSYQIEVWVKMRSGSDQLVVGILTNSTGSGATAQYGAATAIGNAWQKVTTVVTPTWNGVLVSADLYMYTTATKTEFDIDDVMMTNQGTGPALIPIPGTWRQEILTGTPPVVPVGGAVPLPS
jgi:hypothetical protein